MLPLKANKAFTVSSLVEAVPRKQLLPRVARRIAATTTRSRHGRTMLRSGPLKRRRSLVKCNAVISLLHLDLWGHILVVTTGIQRAERYRYHINNIHTLIESQYHFRTKRE